MSWSQEQLSNAAVIYKVGKQLGASTRDIQIAIMAAIVESGLRNVNYGDRDSIGMFQQRDAWGSREQRLDPYGSARMFFLGGHAGQRGLLDFANRDQMGMGQAAQAVQVSAFPDRYDQHKAEASGLLGKIGGVEVPAQGTLGETPDLDALLGADALKALEIPDAPSVTEVNGIGEVTADEVGIGELKFDDPAQTNGLLDTPKFGQPTVDPMQSLHMPTLEDLKLPSVGGTTTGGSGGGNPGLIGFAKKFLGTPYVWGGTSPTGFDCSGFTQYVFKKFGVSLPRISADQGRAGRSVAGKDMRPGDLVFWDNSSRNNGADHVGIYIGNGMFINAPHPGGAVEISHLYGDYWARRVL